MLIVPMTRTKEIPTCPQCKQRLPEDEDNPISPIQWTLMISFLISTAWLFGCIIYDSHRGYRYERMQVENHRIVEVDGRKHTQSKDFYMLAPWIQSGWSTPIVVINEDLTNEEILQEAADQWAPEDEPAVKVIYEANKK